MLNFRLTAAVHSAPPPLCHGRTDGKQLPLQLQEELIKFGESGFVHAICGCLLTLIYWILQLKRLTMKKNRLLSHNPSQWALVSGFLQPFARLLQAFRGCGVFIFSSPSSLLKQHHCWALRSFTLVWKNCTMPERPERQTGEGIL